MMGCGHIVRGIQNTNFQLSHPSPPSDAYLNIVIETAFRRLHIKLPEDQLHPVPRGNSDHSGCLQVTGVRLGIQRRGHLSIELLREVDGALHPIEQGHQEGQEPPVKRERGSVGGAGGPRVLCGILVIWAAVGRNGMAKLPSSSPMPVLDFIRGTVNGRGYICVPPRSVPGPAVTGLYRTSQPQPLSCLFCPSLSFPSLPGVGLAWDQLSEGEVFQLWLCKVPWEKPFMVSEKHMWGDSLLTLRVPSPQCSLAMNPESRKKRLPQPV